MKTTKPVKYLAPYKPLPWQIAPWGDTSPTMLLTGSAGGGKSRIAAEKVHGFMLRYPGSMGAILRKTRESMVNSTVLFFDRAVVGRDPRVRHYPSKHRFEYANGSILAYGGMKNEEQREQIRSIGQDGGLDILWLEEATKFTEDDYNEVLARMRGKVAPWTQIILTTNPGGSTHWINTRLVLGGEAKVYKSSALDNPYNPPEYIEKLKLLTGILGKRLRDGLWVQAEGVVYEEFDEANVTDRAPDPTLPIELAYDEGYVDPRVILFIQRRGHDILVFDEYYRSRQLAEQSVNEVVKRVNEWPWRPPKRDENDAKAQAELIEYEATLAQVFKEVADGSRRILPQIAVGSPEAKELEQRFRLANIPARKRPHEIVEGIKVVRRLIRDGNDYRVLKIHNRCKKFMGELTDGYRYPEENTRRDGEKPLDGNDHACDAFRYWAWVRAQRQ